jgi:hypothetical protein
MFNPARTHVIARAVFVIALALLSTDAKCDDLRKALVASSPLLIVPPAFPDDPPSDRNEVQVDIDGILTSDGRIKTGASITSPPGLESYAKAVLAVVDKWRYIPRVDEGRCESIDSVISTSAWFDLKTKKFFVAKPAPEPDIDSFVPRTRLVDQIAPTYPTIQNGQIVQGLVEVLYKVDADAHVEHASVRYARPEKVFNVVALRSARSVKLEWIDGADRKAFCAYQEFHFCPDGAKDTGWFPGCPR